MAQHVKMVAPDDLNSSTHTHMVGPPTRYDFVRCLWRGAPHLHLSSLFATNGCRGFQRQISFWSGYRARTILCLIHIQTPASPVVSLTALGTSRDLHVCICFFSHCCDQMLRRSSWRKGWFGLYVLNGRSQAWQEGGM